MGGDTRLDLPKVKTEIEDARQRADRGDIHGAFGAMTACALLLADELNELRAEAEAATARLIIGAFGYEPGTYDDAIHNGQPFTLAGAVGAAVERVHEVHRLAATLHDSRDAVRAELAEERALSRAVTTERDEARAEVVRLRHLEDTARALLRLKDGPRDEAYQRAKEPAWNALRSYLKATEDQDEETTP